MTQHRREDSDAVHVASMINIHNCDGSTLVIDSVDDPVGTPARAESVVQRRHQPLVDPVRLAQERARDELVRSGSHRFGQPFSESTSDGRSGPQEVRLGFV
jgi:hypothetical protein